MPGSSPPWEAPQISGVVLPCHPWICGRFPSQLQAGTQTLFNYDWHVDFGESMPPIKVGKPGTISAIKELAGGTRTGATQVEGSRRVLPETTHETSRALNANLRNSNLNLHLDFDNTGEPCMVLDKGVTWSDLSFRKPQQVEEGPKGQR